MPSFARVPRGMRTASVRNQNGAGGREQPMANDQQPRAAAPNTGVPDFDAETLENVGASTTLEEGLMGATPADRLALAEQHIKTLAQRSRDAYTGRLK